MKENKSSEKEGVRRESCMTKEGSQVTGKALGGRKNLTPDPSWAREAAFLAMRTADYCHRVADAGKQDS